MTPAMIESLEKILALHKPQQPPVPKLQMVKQENRKRKSATKSESDSDGDDSPLPSPPKKKAAVHANSTAPETHSSNHKADILLPDPVATRKQHAKEPASTASKESYYKWWEMLGWVRGGGRGGWEGGREGTGAWHFL